MVPAAHCLNNRAHPGFFVQASNSPPGERRGAEWEKWKIAECEVRCMIAGDIEEEIAIDSEERLIE
jgi:hypothetical protein